MVSALQTLRAEEIADSRGMPTLRVFVETEAGTGSASVPSGASTGSREALELRDGGAEHGGRGVQKAIGNVNGEIADALRGKVFDQRTLDQALRALDGTQNKSRLGANAMLGVSMAFARAAAAEAGVPLYAYLALVADSVPAVPCPMFNLINGGKHADNGLAVQEFLCVPSGIAGTAERLRAGQECVAALKKILEDRGEDVSMGDEGGFAPRLGTTEAALKVLIQARSAAGYSAQVRLSLDAAASNFKKGEECSLEQWAALAHTYDLLSIEDPFGENDQENFAALQARTKALVVGDDLTVTSATRITQAARAGAIKAVILKPNQVGTVSETVEAARAAQKAGLVLIASHRSGETDDDFIADLAVGLSCEYLKAGAPTRPERMVKYNRLIAIASELGI